MQILASQLHFLANRNADLTVLPLLSPFSWIKIGGQGELPSALLFILYTAVKGSGNGEPEIFKMLYLGIGSLMQILMDSSDSPFCLKVNYFGWLRPSDSNFHFYTIFHCDYPVSLRSSHRMGIWELKPFPIPLIGSSWTVSLTFFWKIHFYFYCWYSQ